MNSNIRSVYIVALVAALALVVAIYYPGVMQPAPPATDHGAPAMSPLPFHQSFMSEETCLQCHKDPRQINLQGEIMETSQMAHEFRENCVSCHRLPNMM